MKKALGILLIDQNVAVNTDNVVPIVAGGVPRNAVPSHGGIAGLEIVAAINAARSHGASILLRASAAISTARACIRGGSSLSPQQI